MLRALQLPLIDALTAKQLVFVTVDERFANTLRHVRMNEVGRVQRALLVRGEVGRRLQDHVLVLHHDLMLVRWLLFAVVTQLVFVQIDLRK
jgi:hypothetical protein